MSPTMMRISRSMKLTYEILIIKVRIMILTIKIKTETTVITIIPATAPATQQLETTRTTTTMECQTPRTHSRISQPMCKLPSLDQSTGINCLKFRKSLDIHHNTEISYHPMSGQQQVSMLNHLINSTPKRLRSMRQQ